MPKDLKFRGIPKEDEDLSTRVTNLYKYFNQDQFIQDINSTIDNLEINEEFETSLEDNDGKRVKFFYTY